MRKAWERNQGYQARADLMNPASASWRPGSSSLALMLLILTGVAERVASTYDRVNIGDKFD